MILRNIWVYRLILGVVIGIFFEKEKAPLSQEDLALLFASNLMRDIKFSVAQHFYHNKYPSKKQKNKVDTKSQITNHTVR